MNRERLQQMVTMLRNLPEDAIRFDLARWHDDENSCGTTACAVGHACFNKVFTDQGLKLVDDVPNFNGYESWDAVEEFFELSGPVSSDLFYSPHYPNGDRTTPGEVADRIEALLASQS
ncbi:hypothetical protein BZM27_05830 [Paraburkholderia steynii]|uniref:Uncharacterized protein n=1 Tax=Paraburkholderia steynii TaxID=1245441 RepID=A0A4R0XMD4_9BURK|nr:hypothetical protein BZM27_05830 [Paraburkholderia steynii]